MQTSLLDGILESGMHSDFAIRVLSRSSAFVTLINPSRLDGTNTVAFVPLPLTVQGP